MAPLCGSGGATFTHGKRSIANGTQQRILKDLPTEFLDSKNGMLGAHQLVRRKGDDTCHADMLSSFDLDTTQGQPDAAMLRSSLGGPAGAILTAILGGRMTLCNDMFVFSVWHRLGHHIPFVVALPPCKSSAGISAETDYAMVCEKVAWETHKTN